MSSLSGLKAAPSTAIRLPATGRRASPRPCATVFAAAGVDGVHLTEEGQRVAGAELAGPVHEGADVLGQAAAAEAEPGLEEAAPDPGVVAERLGQLDHVAAGELAQVGHRVDEGDLGGQEGVRRDLDQLGGGEVGHHQRAVVEHRAVGLGEQRDRAPARRHRRRQPKTTRSGLQGVLAPRSPRAGTPGSTPGWRPARRPRPRCRCAVPTGTVDLPTTTSPGVSTVSRSATAAPQRRSAASWPRACGVPTQRKCTRRAAAASMSPAEGSRPAARPARSIRRGPARRTAPAPRGQAGAALGVRLDPDDGVAEPGHRGGVRPRRGSRSRSRTGVPHSHGRPSRCGRRPAHRLGWGRRRGRVEVLALVAVPVVCRRGPASASCSPPTPSGSAPTASAGRPACRSWSRVVLPCRTTRIAPSTSRAMMAASATGSSGGASMITMSNISREPVEQLACVARATAGSRWGSAGPARWRARGCRCCRAVWMLSSSSAAADQHGGEADRSAPGRGGRRPSAGAGRRRRAAPACPSGPARSRGWSRSRSCPHRRRRW